jgi:hypothetical protein
MGGSAVFLWLVASWGRANVGPMFPQRPASAMLARRPGRVGLCTACNAGTALRTSLAAFHARIAARPGSAGGSMGRVHVLGPLNDYLRYELACYAQNAEAGEDVRVMPRAAAAGLDLPGSISGSSTGARRRSCTTASTVGSSAPNS